MGKAEVGTFTLKERDRSMRLVGGAGGQEQTRSGRDGPADEVREAVLRGERLKKIKKRRWN